MKENLDPSTKMSAADEVTRSVAERVDEIRLRGPASVADADDVGWTFWNN